MKYGYVRVSTNHQKIDRQFIDIKNFGVDENYIFIDKESGKDFNRDNYQLLKRKLSPGDLLIIKSIDRLGRNYKMILEEWFYLTKIINVDIKVLDMPLLDTRKEVNLIGMFIADIVLSILSFVADNERKTIRLRQQEGIRIAKEKGVKFGRPKKELPSNAFEILDAYRRHELLYNDAIAKLGVSKCTFYRLLKRPIAV